MHLSRSNFEMAQRSGLPTILQLAKQLCKFISVWTPVIQKFYGGNAALMAALASANAACAVLAAAIDDVLPEPI
jgi:hypothetical protein